MVSWIHVPVLFLTDDMYVMLLCVTVGFELGGGVLSRQVCGGRSKTTTTQVCLGYVSQGSRRAAIAYMVLMRPNQPEIAICCLLGLLCAHLFVHVYVNLPTT